MFLEVCFSFVDSFPLWTVFFVFETLCDRFVSRLVVDFVLVESTEDDEAEVVAVFSDFGLFAAAARRCAASFDACKQVKHVSYRRKLP